ncbi:Hypothetical_protein [Hexamita inflata]|uniref:Hypothetical_protein n=1 Tax=Hexamita inflata TaxID=28002 RepID=A0AA86TFQ0_9EUKA|nr:Hypothetical protein HINF_LOCUS2597 [Hexamita inflata]
MIQTRDKLFVSIIECLIQFSIISTFAFLNTIICKDTKYKLIQNMRIDDSIIFHKIPTLFYQLLKMYIYILYIQITLINEPEQEETDQGVMTLFPALNLEALRVAADTLVPRFIPAIPKIVTKVTSKVTNVSSSAELTQVV